MQRLAVQNLKPSASCAARVIGEINLETAIPTASIASIPWQMSAFNG
jgi:hypothetical protein